MLNFYNEQLKIQQSLSTYIDFLVESRSNGWGLIHMLIDEQIGHLKTMLLDEQYHFSGSDILNSYKLNYNNQRNFVTEKLGSEFCELYLPSLNLPLIQESTNEIKFSAPLLHADLLATSPVSLANSAAGFFSNNTNAQTPNKKCDTKNIDILPRIHELQLKKGSSSLTIPEKKELRKLTNRVASQESRAKAKEYEANLEKRFVEESKNKIIISNQHQEAQTINNSLKNEIRFLYSFLSTRFNNNPNQNEDKPTAPTTGFQN